MNSEELKQKKLEELKQKYMEQKEEEQKEFEVENQMQTLLKKVLDDEARARLSNVRLINKDLYSKAFQAIMGLVQKGFVTGKLNDAQVKEILMQLKSKREISIRRK